jgi:hypothetical protein
MVGTRTRRGQASAGPDSGSVPAVISPSLDSTRYSDVGGGSFGGSGGSGGHGLTIPVLLNEAQKSSVGPGQVRVGMAARQCLCVAAWVYVVVWLLAWLLA